MLEYIKSTLTGIKGESGRNPIIVGDFKSPLTSMVRFLKQKISKATAILNDTIAQLNLLDIVRTLLGEKAYTFFKVYMKYSLGLTTY